MDYALTDLTRVEDVVTQVMHLQNTAFAEYPGAARIEEPQVEWYSRRPGFDPSICQAALHGDRLVSNVLVYMQPLQFGRDLLRCGIVAAVATDPEHQKQGLARRLIDRAHEAFISRGCDAAMLFTDPDDHPYHFYERLGYEERARVCLMLGQRPEPGACAALPLDAAEEASGLISLINDYFAGHEGFAPLTGELWQWNRLDAPEPPTVVAEHSAQGPISTASFSQATVEIGGEEQTIAMAFDLAADVMNADQLESLLSAAPLEKIALAVDEEAPEYVWATGVGFEPQFTQVSMILPFTDEARHALADHHGPWYAAVEAGGGI